MSIPAKQIGWSTETNLLWEVAKLTEKLLQVIGASGGGGGGSVLSVNGQTGIVTLSATDLDALKRNGSNTNSDIDIGNNSYRTDADFALNGGVAVLSSSRYSQRSGLYSTENDQVIADYDNADNIIYRYGNGKIEVNETTDETLITTASTKVNGSEIVTAGVDNATTVVLTASDLNTQYPNAKTNFVVWCKDIIGGALRYEKTEDGTWVSSIITVVV